MGTFTLYLPDSLTVRLDAARGEVPRSLWIRRAVSMRLGGGSFEAEPREAAVIAEPLASDLPTGNIGWHANADGNAVKDEPSPADLQARINAMESRPPGVDAPAHDSPVRNTDEWPPPEPSI